MRLERKGALRHRKPPSSRRLYWALCHPFRLLQRYGFGWFQFGVLAVPVLVFLWLVADIGRLLGS
jgi:hypothetical protein